MRPNGVQVALLLGQLSEEWLREKDAETTVRSQGGSAEIHRGRCEPQVGVWSDGGRRLRHLPTVLSPTTPGLFMGTDGTPRSHPQFSELKWGNASAQPDSCHPLPSPQTHTRWVSWPFAPAAPLCSYVLD